MSVENSDETIWKFGTIGDQFYIILKGETSVFIPCHTIIELNILEYYRLIKDYSEMILEVDGSDSFELPTISKKLIELSWNIDLNLLIHKLNQSSKKQSSEANSKSNPPDSSRSQSIASVRNDVLSGDISAEEK